VAPDYQVREDAKDQKSIAAMNAEAMAAQQLQHGQLDEAERQARLAVEADPKAADAHTMLAVVLQQRGSSKAAGVEYEKAVALAPQSGTVLNNYAAWLCGNGRAAESLPVFDRALADPSYPTPATALANAGAGPAHLAKAASALDHVSGFSVRSDPGHEIQTLFVRPELLSEALKSRGFDHCEHEFIVVTDKSTRKDYFVPTENGERAVGRSA